MAVRSSMIGLIFEREEDTALVTPHLTLKTIVSAMMGKSVARHGKPTLVGVTSDQSLLARFDVRKEEAALHDLAAVGSGTSNFELVEHLKRQYERRRTCVRPSRTHLKWRVGNDMRNKGEG